MHIKYALARAEDDSPTLQLVTPGKHVKTAGVLPAVSAFLDALRPQEGFTYGLGTALSDSQFFGSNSNADWYGYNPHLRMNGLTWDPDKTKEHGEYPNWRTDPIVQQRLAKHWPYGYPTFYGANVFAHHKNHDPALGFGDVMMAYWNDRMKRVELVMRINNKQAAEKGHSTFIERLHTGKRVDLSMGCFAAGAMITMADGTRKPIEKIRVGDRVITHTGATSTVTETHRRKYTGTLFTVRPANEDAFVTTVEHPFWAAPDAKNAARVWRDARPAFGWTFAKDLDGHVLSRPRLKRRNVKSVDPAMARMLGYYLAEGHPVKGKRGKWAGIELSVGKADAVLDEIRELTEALGIKYTVRDVPHTSKAATIGLYTRELAEMCVHYCGKGSKSKKLHADVLHWPEHVQLAFLGAYANGDGHSANGALGLSTASIDLANQLRELCFVLGMPASQQKLTHLAGSGFSTKDTVEWVVYIGKQWAPRLAPFTVKVTPVPVKKPINHYKDYGDLWAVPIREYDEFCGTLEVFNFEVEGDNSYLVNGVAAHNCKIPFDACSICTDWGAVHAAMSTYNPKVHAHPGIPVLNAHRQKKIRGIAETRAEYCPCMQTQKNQILPDGRRVFVYNDFMRFFDISCVWIGADKTAKVMAVVRKDGTPWKPPVKKAEMEKEIPGGVMDILADAKSAPDIGTLGIFKRPPQTMLSTMATLGIIPTPSEFMQLVMPQMGAGAVLDKCKARGVIFDISAPGIDSSYSFDPAAVDGDIAHVLGPWMGERSAYEPHLSKRLKDPRRKKVATAELTALRNPLLDDVARKYAGYRVGIIENIPKIMNTLDNLSVGWTQNGKMTPEFAGLLLGIGTVVHLFASHLHDKEGNGEQLGSLQHLMAKNPGFSALASMGIALRAAVEADKAGGITKALSKLVRTIA